MNYQKDNILELIENISGENYNSKIDNGENEILKIDKIFVLQCKNKKII